MVQSQHILHVWPEEPISVSAHVEFSANVESAKLGRHRLWYRVPAEFAARVQSPDEAFAIACVSFAMATNAALHVHGTVSPSLLQNLEEFTKVWHCWNPDSYAQITIAADRELEVPSAPNDHAIACFSGGADACTTVYRHTQRLCDREAKDLRAGLMIHGFDIPLTNIQAMEIAFKRSERILRSVNVEPMWLATNWRELEHASKLSWIDVFGSAAVSCLALFRSAFRYGLIASGDRYYFVRTHGSTPLTDPMLSSEGFRIRNDGAAYSRTQKLAMIAGWPEAMQNLRVCWEGADPSRNCGECEKCIRTVLNFRAIGVPLPSCFDKDISEGAITRVPIRNSTQLKEYQSILHEARARGLASAHWVRTLEKRVSKAEREPTLFRRLARAGNFRRHLNRLRSIRNVVLKLPGKKS